MKTIFISVVLGGIWKKLILFMRNFILLPFKIGTWLFMGGLVGINVNQVLHWFDFLKLNIPNWFYNKLLDAHLNWISWFKRVWNIESLSTNELEEVKIKNTQKIDHETLNSNKETSISNKETTIKPETFMYLNKEQWLIVLGITMALSLICAGVYIKFYWGDSTDTSSGDPDIQYRTSNLEKQTSPSKVKSKIKSLFNLRAPIDTPESEGIPVFPETPKTDITAMEDTPKAIEKALERAKAKMGWYDYIKNKISNVLPGKTSDIDTPSSHPHQIWTKNNTTKDEGTLSGLTPEVAKENENLLNDVVEKVKKLKSNLEGSKTPTTSPNPPSIRSLFPPVEGDLGLKDMFTPKTQPQLGWGSLYDSEASTSNIKDSINTSTSESTSLNSTDPLTPTSIDNSKTPTPLDNSKTPTRFPSPMPEVTDKLTGSSRPVSPLPDDANEAIRSDWF